MIFAKQLFRRRMWTAVASQGAILAREAARFGPKFPKIANWLKVGAGLLVPVAALYEIYDHSVFVRRLSLGIRFSWMLTPKSTKTTEVVPSIFKPIFEAIPGSGRVFVVHGPPKCGKSTSFKKAMPFGGTIYIDLHPNPGESVSDALRRQLCGFILFSPSHFSFGSVVKTLQFVAKKRMLVPGRKPLVLVIDGIDKWSKDKSARDELVQIMADSLGPYATICLIVDNASTLLHLKAIPWLRGRLSSIILEPTKDPEPFRQHLAKLLKKRGVEAPAEITLTGNFGDVELLAEVLCEKEAPPVDVAVERLSKNRQMELWSVCKLSIADLDTTNATSVSNAKNRWAILTRLVENGKSKRDGAAHAAERQLLNSGVITLSKNGEDLLFSSRLMEMASASLIASSEGQTAQKLVYRSWLNLAGWRWLQFTGIMRLFGWVHGGKEEELAAEA